MSLNVEGKHYCRKCMKFKPMNKRNFYDTTNPAIDTNGFLSVCVKCCQDMYEEYFSIYGNVPDAIKRTCRDLDIIYDDDCLEQTQSHVATSISNGREVKAVFGIYKSKTATLGRKEGVDTQLRYHDSANVVDPVVVENEIKEKDTYEVTEEVIHKWGAGYEPQEYEAFERKYNLLKNNYPEKTSMHTEALLIYIRYRVKEEFATANGSVGEAKSWGALAKDAGSAAKINPNQLSKADLSDGLSTFSELSQAVEKEVDVIPILPRFKYRPNDALDFNLWCYINYERDLSGMPLCDYEDVYKFYDERKADYIKQTGDPYNIFKDDPTEENREKIKHFISDDRETEENGGD